jgi:hypothetical protein
MRSFVVRSPILIYLAAVFLAGAPFDSVAQAGTVFHVVNDYEGLGDSPFDTSRLGSGLFFEDFETGRRFGMTGLDLGVDQDLIIPGISVSGGVGNLLMLIVGMGTQSGNSIEGGDSGKSAVMETRRGLLPLSLSRPAEFGYLGHRWFSFDESTLGFLPTEVGFAWTGGNDEAQLNVRVRGRDGMYSGNQLSVVGDGTTQFIGVSDLDGIGSLEIDAIGQVPITVAIDHFQHGAPRIYSPSVPEPTSLVLVLLGLVSYVGVAYKWKRW